MSTQHSKADNTESRRDHALRLVRERRYQAAVKLLEPLTVEFGDGDPELFAALGRCHWSLENYDEAIRLCDRASALDPSDAESMFLAGRSLKKSGQMSAALARFETLTARFPAFAEGWNLLGSCLRESGRFEDAISAYEKYLSMKPEAVEATNAYVMALVRGGYEEKARTVGLRLLKLKHDNAISAFAKASENLSLHPAEKIFNPSKPKRNVICFSLWGNLPAYVTGAILNARIASAIYPGWTCRFYCDPNVPSDALEQLRLSGAQVIMMPGPDLARLRNMWRFFASDDPEVDFFLCRDTDSRLNVKEAIAVDLWLKSGKPFHVIRDHLYHTELMLAGMWGGMAGVLPDQRRLIDAKHGSSFYHFGDQAYLARYVWPLICDHVVQHDKYYAFHGAAPLDCNYELAPWQHIGGSTKSDVPHWSTIAYPTEDTNS